MSQLQLRVSRYTVQLSLKYNSADPSREFTRTWLPARSPNFLLIFCNRVFRYGGDHYGANRNSGREISSFGPEMCTPQFLRPGVPLRRGSLRYGAHRHSGREISHSGPEMCTPLFLRPKSKPAGREKPIRVAPIRVVTKYPM